MEGILAVLILEWYVDCPETVEILMPKGCGGVVCVTMGQVKTALADDPEFEYEVVALDVDAAEEQEPLKVALAGLDDGSTWKVVAALFELSPIGKVAVQYKSK